MARVLHQHPDVARVLHQHPDMARGRMQVFLMSLVCNVHPDAQLLRFGYVAPPRLLGPPGFLAAAGGMVADESLVPHPLALQEQEVGWLARLGYSSSGWRPAGAACSCLADGHSSGMRWCKLPA
jgi:hypothetical protein